MATTFEPYNGDGSDTTFAFNHPSYQESDIKVTVDGSPYTNTGVTGGSPGATTFTIPNYTTSSAGDITFNVAPGIGAVIRIFRDTNVDVAKATFQAGSSVKAADLNNTVTQLLYAAQEEQNQLEQTADIQDSAITSAKIKDDTIVNADIKSDAAIAGTKVTPAFGSQNLSTSGTAATGALTVTGNIAVSGTVDGRDVATDGSKLDGIDVGAKDDQTAAEIRVLVEAATDSNVFTDADHTKLNNIEDNATADQTSSDIKTLLASDNLTDAHLAENSVGTSEIKDDAVGADQLANTSVTAGSYGTTTSIPTIVVDAQGRVTSASGNTIDTNLVADTSPQLGGNLDVQTREITTSGTNQDITLTPTGSGTVTVKGTGSASGTVEVNTETNAKSIKIQAPTNSNLAGNYTLTLPVNDGDNGQFLKTDGLGVLSWDTVSGGGGGGGTAAPNNIVTLSESVDGNRTDFSMSVTPASAQNLIVSVNGVVQKPNAGTTIAGSAEGYCIDGATLKFATAPANGSSIFIIEHAATTASDRIVEGNSNVDIFDDNATSRAVVNLDGNEKFRVNEGGQIGLGGANYGTDGQVLTSQGSGAAAQWETIPIEVANDTSPQLGGDLDVQNRKITSTSTNASINLEPNGNGVVAVRGAGGADGTLQLNCSQNSHGVKIKSPAHSAGASYTLTLPTTDGNANQVLKTDGSGVLAWVDQTTDTVVGGATGVDFNDNVKARFGTGNDLEIFVDSNNASHIKQMTDGQYLNLHANDFWVGDQAGVETYILANHNGAVQLYYDNSKKFETISTGVSITGNLGIGTTSPNNAIHLKGTDPVIEMEDTAGGDRQGIFVSDAGYLGFYNFTDGRVDMVIDGTGNVGIRTTTPSNLNSAANDLVIGSGGGSTAGMTIYTTNTGTGNIYFADGDSGSAEYAGYIQYAHAQNKMIFGPGAGATGTEMVLDSAGKLGIGGTPTAKLYVEQSAASAYVTNNNTETNSSYTAYALSTPTQNLQMWINGPNNSSYGGANACTFWETANTGFNFYSNSVLDAKIDTTGIRIPSGKGINFADYATSGNPSSNLLDDYEEGTWTPVLQGYTGTQWDDVTYDDALDNTNGNYVKIGSLVYIYFYTGAFSLDSGWNNAYARINGLPYVFRNAEPYYGGQFTFTHTNCFKDLSGNLFDCHSAYGVYNTTYINPSIGNTSNQAKWGSEATRYIMVAGVYQTNV